MEFLLANRRWSGHGEILLLRFLLPGNVFRRWFRGFPLLTTLLRGVIQIGLTYLIGLFPSLLALLLLRGFSLRRATSRRPLGGNGDSVRNLDSCRAVSTLFGTYLPRRNKTKIGQLLHCSGLIDFLLLGSCKKRQPFRSRSIDERKRIRNPMLCKRKFLIRCYSLDRKHKGGVRTYDSQSVLQIFEFSPE